MTPSLNQLVARASRQDRQRLNAIGELIRLVPGAVLFERGEATVSVYFPTAGAVLLAVPAQATSGLAVLLVGNEGMLGMHRVMGDSLSPWRAVVQIGGIALRVDAAEFSLVLSDSVCLHGAMLDYVGGVLNQIARAAACARFRDIGPRLASWLLMIRDRGGAGSFPITQELLATTLGVRRVGVTEAACELQRLNLIDYHRGTVSVLDIPGLRAFAGNCYAESCATRPAPFRCASNAEHEDR